MSLDTTLGENWTVAAYTVEPDRWMEVTARLFKRFTRLEEASLPHYTVEAWHPQIFTITSFRVQRRPVDEAKIVSELDGFMEGNGWRRTRSTPLTTTWTSGDATPG